MNKKKKKNKKQNKKLKNLIVLLHFVVVVVVIVVVIIVISFYTLVIVAFNLNIKIIKRFADFEIDLCLAVSTSLERLFFNLFSVVFVFIFFFIQKGNGKTWATYLFCCKETSI